MALGNHLDAHVMGASFLGDDLLPLDTYKLLVLQEDMNF